MLMLNKPKCENIDITTIRTSPETHIHWKDRFYKNPLFCRIYADFEADKEKHNSNIGYKTTNFYKQDPVINGYQVISVLEDVLKSGYYESPLLCDIVDWFVIEVIKFEKNGFLY